MNINLLPWRENKITKIKNEFYIQLSISICLAVFTMFFVNMDLKNRIEKMDSVLKVLNLVKHQQERISKIHRPRIMADLIKDEIKIQKARKNIQKIVFILSTLANMIPPTVFLQTITFEKANLLLDGTTYQDNEAIFFLEKIATLKFLNNAHLNTLVNQSHKVRFIFQAYV